MRDTTKELQEIVEQLSYRAPDGSGSGSIPMTDVTQLLGGLSFSSTGASPLESSSLIKAVDVKDLLSSLSSLSSSQSPSNINTNTSIDLPTPPTPPSSPTMSTSMLNDHDGIKYQVLHSRQQQLVRNVAAIDERLASLKKNSQQVLNKSQK